MIEVSKGKDVRQTEEIWQKKVGKKRKFFPSFPASKDFCCLSTEVKEDQFPPASFEFSKKN